MRKLTLSLALMAALLPASGYPLGLGEIELDSALNQELNARIVVISASQGDADTLLVKLASREAFSRVGLDRPFTLQQLKFKVIERNGQLFIKVFTKSPVREPFLSFLVEIDWPKGHLLREYTLLLDPPVYNTGQSAAPASAGSSHPFINPADAQAQAQSASTQQQTAQGGYAAQTGVVTSSSGRSTNYQYQPLPQSNTSIDQYRVQKNDTLWRIANRMRPDNSVSVEQMMLALLRRNPEAFIRGNINGVKRGYILRAPAREEITRIDRQQAVSLAREQFALWREYSQAAVSNSPASSMEADMEMGAAAEQPRSVDGHLSIMGAAEGSELSGSNQDPNAELARIKQDLAMAREELESAKLEKQNLQTRLAELEQQVKSVIEMDDEGLAKLQNDLQKTQQGTQPAEEMPLEDNLESAAQESSDEEPIVEEMSGEETLNEEIAADESPVEDNADDLLDEPAEDEVFVDETEAGEAIVDVDAESLQPMEPVEAIEPPAFAQQKSEGFIDNLMNDPKLLGIIGGGLAFIFLLVALLLKRLRGNKAEDDEWDAALEPDVQVNAEESFNLGDIEDPTVLKPATDMGSTTEMMADTMDALSLDDTLSDAATGDADTADDLENAVFSLEDEEASKTEEEVPGDDVLAEADVYLAYGIYQQAEELLSNAIDQNPERDDYRLKLLEVYYASKNAPAFEQLAQDVQVRQGDDKAYWDRVVAMGMEICPDNSMFTGTDSMLSDFDAEALLPEKPQKTDLELDAGNGLDDELDLGLSDTSEVQAMPEVVNDEMDLAGELESITESTDTETAADDTNAELEFDLGELDGDLGSTDEEQTTEAESADLDIDDDFSLDFDASDLGFEEPESEEDVQAEETSLDADLDLGDIEDSALSDESSEIDFSAEDGSLDMDMSDLDLGTSMDDEAPAVNESMEIDISAEDDDFDISELSEDVDEVGTKLDLARAYIDMGDSEGARSILEEVKAEGNNEQQQQAEALLQKAS